MWRNGGDSNIWKVTKIVFRDEKKNANKILFLDINFWWNKTAALASKESCHHHHPNCNIALTLIVCGGCQGSPCDDGTLKIHLKLFTILCIWQHQCVLAQSLQLKKWWRCIISFFGCAQDYRLSLNSLLLLLAQ